MTPNADSADSPVSSDSGPDAGTRATSGPSRTRVWIGVGLLVGSFVPFLVSGWVAAQFDHGETHVGGIVMLLYGVSVVMWYLGLAIGGEVMLRSVRTWWASRRAGRKEHRAATSSSTG